MVQACAVICITYVHARALTHGVQALQDLDVGRIIGFGFYGHSAFLSQSENYTRFGCSLGFVFCWFFWFVFFLFFFVFFFFFVFCGFFGFVCVFFLVLFL